MITRIVVSDSNFGIGTFFKTLTYKINYENANRNVQQNLQLTVK